MSDKDRCARVPGSWALAIQWCVGKKNLYQILCYSFSLNDCWMVGTFRRIVVWKKFNHRSMPFKTSYCLCIYPISSLHSLDKTDKNNIIVILNTQQSNRKTIDFQMYLLSFHTHVRIMFPIFKYSNVYAEYSSCSALST